MNKIPEDELKQRRAYRADRHGSQGDVLPALEAVPKAPSWLSAGGRSHWPTVAKSLADAGILRAVDVLTVGMLCDAMAEYQRLRDASAAESPVCHGEKLSRPNPLLKAVNDARADVVRLMRECGMSPRARRGLKLGPPAPKAGEIVKPPNGFAT